MFNLDWEKKEKLVCNVNEYKDKFSIVHEFFVSPDGEKIAATVEIEDKKLTPCINGKTWNNTFERVCFLNFFPDDSIGHLSRILCLGIEFSIKNLSKFIGISFQYRYRIFTSAL